MLASLAAGAALGCVYALLSVGFRVSWDATRAPNLAWGGLVLVGAFVGLKVAGMSVVALSLALVIGAVLGCGAQLLLKAAVEPWRKLAAGFGVTLLAVGLLAPLWPEAPRAARPELGLGMTVAQGFDAAVALGLLLVGLGLMRLRLDRTSWPAVLLAGAAASGAGFLLARAYVVSPPSALLYTVVGVAAAASGGRRLWLAALAGLGIAIVQTLAGASMQNVAVLVCLIVCIALRAREFELAAE
ncbi:MAG TPA: hypothetical protein VFS62_00505 [Chloroflexota bacterium]|jgi:branched-subunit amino acid ABC-type transport system permease component|nr:hypothetical protein [Chloroflexota bacterium]